MTFLDRIINDPDVADEFGTARRTDIHRPSAIEPLDYEFVGFDYLGNRADPTTIMAERAAIHAHMARTGGRYSQHAHGGSCHICGASALYTALHYHAKSNTYVRTGLDCADKLGCGDAEAFRVKIERAIEAYAGKRKAQATLEAEGIAKAWTIYTTPVTGRDTTYEERTIADIVFKLVRYGSISDKAMGYLKALVDKVDRAVEIAAERIARRAAEDAAAAPVPTDGERRLIRGTVISIKEGDFGPRMLVKTAEGFKVFGAVPSIIRDGLTRGVAVEFYATVRPSNDDPKFGFFSRPTKAVITTEDGAAL